MCSFDCHRCPPWRDHGLTLGSVDWAENKLYLCENRVYAGERRNQHHAKDRGKPLCFRFTFCYGPSETLEGGAGSHIPKTGDHSLRLCSDGGERRADAPGQPTDWLYKFSKRHDLPPIHPHKFRHTQASLLIAQGVDILTVSKRLGQPKFQPRWIFTAVCCLPRATKRQATPWTICFTGNRRSDTIEARGGLYDYLLYSGAASHDYSGLRRKVQINLSYRAAWAWMPGPFFLYLRHSKSGTQSR